MRQEQRAKTYAVKMSERGASFGTVGPARYFARFDAYGVEVSGVSFEATELALHLYGDSECEDADAHPDGTVSHYYILRKRNVPTCYAQIDSVETNDNPVPFRVLFSTAIPRDDE